VVVAALLAMMAIVIAAAMWAPLHQWLHGKVDDGDDDCAIALYVTGNCEPPCVEVVICVAPMRYTPEVIEWRASWVPSVFLSACAFEHGPPRAS
jgi:hypothetical protein